MDKDGAAAPGNPRASVVIKFDNEIVQGILPRESVGLVVLWDGNPPIVTAVLRIFAPTVVQPDAPNG